MNSFYGGISSGFSSIEGYLSKWRHRNILFTPVPKRDISGQPVSAWTFNVQGNPAIGIKRDDHSKQSKEFMLYNDLYDKDKVNKYVNSLRTSSDYPGWGRDIIISDFAKIPKWDFNPDALSLIYCMIIGNMAGFHADINNKAIYGSSDFIDRQGNIIPKRNQILKKRADYIFLKNLITAWPEMSQRDKDFFKLFVKVTDKNASPVAGPGGAVSVNVSLENVQNSKIDEDMNNYEVKIKEDEVFKALPETPDNLYDVPKNVVRDIYKEVYDHVIDNRVRGYYIPPPGHEFLTMFNYIGFMEKIMNNGLPSKIPADQVRNIFEEDDLTKIITEIGVIKEIWSRDANGDLVFKHGDKLIRLNDEDQKIFIQDHFELSQDNCIGTYFKDKEKCNDFIFKCINHKGNNGNLKKCIEYITKTDNFPKDLNKEVQKVHPERAINFLRALGYKIISVGNIDRMQNWNEWMSNTVGQSNLSAEEKLNIQNNENLKRLLTYFVEYINANPAILNKKYDSTKKKVKSLDPCPYPWITKLGFPSISRNMKYEKNVYNSINNIYQFLFHDLIKPKPVTKQSLFGNNSMGVLNNLASLLPMLVMGTTHSGGSSKITFPYFNKKVIRQMNGGSPLLNINIDQHDNHNSVNLFYKHIDSIVQHHRNRNMNIFTDADVTEVKELVRDLDNLIKKIQKKMGKLELVNQLINSGFPGIEKLIPLNDKLMDKIVVYVNTVHNGEYNVKSLLNSIVTAMLEEEFGSINLNYKPITSIH